MPRAIYQKEIYKREKQLDRAVYKNHKRNVIPVDSGKYIVKSISIALKRRAITLYWLC